MTDPAEMPPSTLSDEQRLQVVREIWALEGVDYISGFDLIYAYENRVKARMLPLATAPEGRGAE